MICHVYRRGRLYWGKLQLDHEPRMSRMPLATADRRVAQSKLAEIAHDREKQHAGLLPPDSVREAAARPLSSLLDDFLAELQVKGRTVGTLAKYRSNLKNCFAGTHWKILRDVTVRSFCGWRAHCSLSPKSLNDTLGALMSFYSWLRHQRLVSDNPLADIQAIDTRGRCAQFRRSFSSTELGRLLAKAPVHRQIIYLTAAYTGLRRSELCSLRWADVVLDSALLRIRASTTKNRKDAVLPLHPDLVAALREICPADAAPFSPVFRYVPRVLTLRRDLVAAGIPFLDAQGRRADLHSLRVTYGTNLTLSGAAPRVVMELMRHSEIALTMKLYTDAGQLPLAEAVAKLPSLATKTVCPETCPKTCPDGGRNQSEPVAS